MPIEILMPALSPTMSEGTLARWLKAEGEAVKPGDVLAEIETDKATMEFEAADEGILGRILVPGGTAGVKVNQPIGLLLEEGEDRTVLDRASRPSNTSVMPGLDPGIHVAAATPALAMDPRVKPGGDESRRQTGARTFASPLARRIAAEAGLDLARLTGSGPQGRIVKADVEQAIQSGTGRSVAAPAPAVTKAPPPALAPFEPAYEEIPNSSIRKVIARRLTEAKATVPHFYLSVDCQVDALLKIRADLNARLEGGKLSVNDFVVRAVALALKTVPAANASWGEEAIRRYRDIDISVAVATDNGLITPIVHHADRKGLAEISAAMKTLAAKARDGKLKPEEFQGGGFTVSNLGMYGIKSFSAILNPPQGCILAVGAAEQRPVVKDGALAVATVMTCTLSVDHRVVDGAVGAEFLAAFKGLIEDPLSMLL
ncbi:MAG: pyruvate dehydrogenase complex dihydrolipoamide acetyltransferase [Magnetospirillum sp.]|nr:pyruvate dehydrogenase complex dihydrolipoamide acetyltransferase [Magnetospirillum sp.]